MKSRAGTLAALAALIGLAVPTGIALGQPAGGLEFAEWSAVSADVATGTLAGTPISLSGTHVSAPPASSVDGTATVFSGPSFSPPLPTSDAIEIRGSSPAYDYTLDLGGPTPNPVIHLASLGSTLTFPSGTEITKVSGEDTFTVSGHTVSGVANTATDDSRGTIQLIGTFTSLGFTADYGGAFPDGFYVQVGADFAPPETTITAGPPDGTVVGDTPPAFEFVSSEPNATFECRAYDPVNPPGDFQPCVSPFQPTGDSFELGETTQLEVRAIDSSGNVDPTPATRLYTRHGKFGKPPAKSPCDPVPLHQVIGRKVEDNCRISEIKHGRVPCLSVNTGRPAKCAFSKHHERWLRSKSGRAFAVVGDPVSKTQRAKAKYVVATRVGEKKVVPCADTPDAPKRAERDTAGAPSGSELAVTCVLEAIGKPWNVSGEPMDNVTTRTVCMSNAADLQIDLNNSPTSVTSPPPPPGSTCWIGDGAGLNDPNGTERNAYGVYRSGPHRCHIIVSNGYETYAAKRPATTGYPAKVDFTSPSLWRPYTPYVSVAN